MTNFDDIFSVKRALTTAQRILVALPQRPNKDKVAAALGLFLSFQKTGKNSTVVCPSELTVEFSSLIGVDKIGQKLSGNNLVISLDYIEDSIEKVSYNIESGKFNLVIQPKEDSSPIQTDKIEYSYSGGQADLVFVIGSYSLSGLGAIYQKNKELFEEEKVVNLDNDSNNSQFGKIRLVDVSASSCSELAVGFLSKSSLPVDADIASNLFYGLQEATRNFSSPKVGPGTFEAAAFCLRSGAKRQALGSFKTKKKKEPALAPMSTEISASRPPGLAESSQPGPSSDWFEPKIFRGSTRI